MCKHLPIQIYRHTHANTCIYLHYTYTCKRIHIHLYTYIYIHQYTYMYISDLQVHIRIQVYVYVYIRIDVYVYMCICVYMYICIYVYMHISKQVSVHICKQVSVYISITTIERGSFSQDSEIQHFQANKMYFLHLPSLYQLSERQQLLQSSNMEIQNWNQQRQQYKALMCRIDLKHDEFGPRASKINTLQMSNEPVYLIYNLSNLLAIQRVS